MNTIQFLHFRPEWHAALRESCFLPSVAWDLTGQVCCTRNVFHNCRRILPQSNQLVAGRRKARAMLQNSPRPPPTSFDYKSQKSSIIGTPKPTGGHNLRQNPNPATSTQNSYNIRNEARIITSSPRAEAHTKSPSTDYISACATSMARSGTPPHEHVRNDTKKQHFLPAPPPPPPGISSLPRRAITNQRKKRPQQPKKLLVLLMVHTKIHLQNESLDWCSHLSSTSMEVF